MSALAFSSQSADAELTESDFRMVAEIIRREAGIVVRDHKQAMVRGRLARRVRELGLASIAEYCRLLRGDELARELPGLMNALTTNHTAFYREEHHFTHLEQTALPAFAAASKLRIWCAAASTGEEPYTIAATVHAHSGGRLHADALILATDLDSDVLEIAQRGQYAATAFERLTSEQRSKLRFTASGQHVEAPETLKTMLRFRQLNILHEWPFRGPFQIIFCRNMLIYFDQPTKSQIVSRLVDKLSPGGFLYLGHSEALPQAVDGLRPCGRTTYVRM
jgi:chemotaxis protein methyltransferase CheR